MYFQHELSWIIHELNHEFSMYFQHELSRIIHELNHELNIYSRRYGLRTVPRKPFDRYIFYNNVNLIGTWIIMNYPLFNSCGIIRDLIRG